MTAKKKDVVILVFIAIFSGLLLSGTFKFTEEPIKEAQERLLQQALRSVMPFMEDTYKLESHSFQGVSVPVYRVEKDGVLQGAALKLTTKEGYSGDIDFLLGVDAEKKVTGLFILKHAETPGLGAKATDEKWWGQFVGKSKPEFNFNVKKDGGDVDSITASTITSRAIGIAIDKGLDLYEDYLNSPGEELKAQ